LEKGWLQIVNCAKQERFGTRANIHLQNQICIFEEDAGVFDQRTSVCQDATGISITREGQ
jgi:hypothetical protein